LHIRYDIERVRWKLSSRRNDEIEGWSQAKVGKKIKWKNYIFDRVWVMGARISLIVEVKKNWKSKF